MLFKNLILTLLIFIGHSYLGYASDNLILSGISPPIKSTSKESSSTFQLFQLDDSTAQEKIYRLEITTIDNKGRRKKKTYQGTGTLDRNSAGTISFENNSIVDFRRHLGLLEATGTVDFQAVYFYVQRNGGSDYFPILEYDYGNQIGRTIVRVFSNGEVKIGQHGSGRTTEVSSKKLSKKDLRSLIDAIEKASKGNESTDSQGITADGSSSGRLIVNLSEDQRSYRPLTIVSSDRGNRDGEPNTITLNRSEGSIFILELVSRYVKNPAHLPSACFQIGAQFSPRKTSAD